MCGAPIEEVSRPIGLQLHMPTRPPINSLLPKIMAGSRYSHASAVDLILMQRQQGDTSQLFHAVLPGREFLVLCMSPMAKPSGA